jgi:hypothetical protein
MRRHRVATLVVVLALALFATPLLTRTPYLSVIDLSVWGDDWLRLSYCVQRWDFPCENESISKFPTAYLFDSYYVSAMRARGFDPAWALGLLNTTFLALPVLFVVFVRGVRASLPLSLTYILAILLTAVPPFYVFGAVEVQSGVVIGIFISSLVLMQENLERRRATVLSLVLLITSLLLPLYKDTNTLVLFVALAITGIQAWLAKRHDSKEPDPRIIRWRRSARLLLTGLCAALAISFTYNFVKGGSMLPLAYLNEAAQTSPRPAKILEFLAATYFSPNGGVIVFWGFALWATMQLLRGFGFELSPAGTSVALAVASIYSVILSCWWVPFGWDAWGDRLMVPAMLATVICLTATARERSLGPQEPLRRQERRASWSRRGRLARMIWDGAIIVMVLVSFHFTVVSYYSNKPALWMASLFGGPRCAQMGRDLGPGEASMGLGFWRSHSYYACARERFIHVPRYISDQARP